MAILTDIFENGEWVNLEPHTFNDGSFIPHHDLPKQYVDNNYISRGLRAFGMAMGALIMVASVGFTCWTQIHSETKVVKASQPIFLHIICSGTMLMGSAIIPLTIDDGFASESGCQIACHAFPWLFFNGFVISFSALFTKTHRINYIFHQPNFKRVSVSPLDVTTPLFVLVGGERRIPPMSHLSPHHFSLTTPFRFTVNILILSLWTALSETTWERTVLAEDKFGRPIETHGFCYYDSSLPMPLLLLLLILVWLYMRCMKRTSRGIFRQNSQKVNIFSKRCPAYFWLALLLSP